jgi:hypothetical protein
LFGDSRLAQVLENPGGVSLCVSGGTWFTVGKRRTRTTLRMPWDPTVVDGRETAGQAPDIARACHADISSEEIVLWILIALSLIGWLTSGAHAETVTWFDPFQGYRICQGLNGYHSRWDNGGYHYGDENRGKCGYRSRDGGDTTSIRRNGQ